MLVLQRCNPYAGELFTVAVQVSPSRLSSLLPSPSCLTLSRPWTRDPAALEIAAAGLVFARTGRELPGMGSLRPDPASPRRIWPPLPPHRRDPPSSVAGGCWLRRPRPRLGETTAAVTGHVGRAPPLGPPPLHRLGLAQGPASLGLSSSWAEAHGELQIQRPRVHCWASSFGP